jgi:hypothetical protein
MLPRRSPQRPRLESGIALRDPDPRPADAESDEPISAEDDERRRAYAAWLARFDRDHAAA